MGLFNSSRERTLETSNKVQQFTIDCQDTRLEAQKFLLDSKDNYIKECEAIIAEQQAEIENLRKRLDNQRSINSQMDIQLSLFKEKGGDFGLN